MSEHLKNNGFIMITPDTELAKIGCRKINPFTKLPLKEIIPSEVSRMFKPTNNTNESELYNEMRLVKKYNILLESMSNREIHETGAIVHQAAELIDPKIESLMSYGLFVPSYQEELNLQKKNSSPQYRSLLIGALTPNTAIEYTATVKSIFPEAQTSIIDLETAKIKDKPGLILADGLNTPFATDTFSSIHTNYLLHMLEGKNTESIKNIKNLFTESYRILNKKGKLIMCEGNLSYIFGIDKHSAIQKIKQLLADSGFSDVKIKPAIKFKNRQEMTRYFRSTDGLKEIVTEKTNGSMIIATKQDQKLKNNLSLYLKKFILKTLH